MHVLLDTDICIHLINRRPGCERVLRRISGRSFGEIAISAVTISELRFGVEASAHPRKNGAALEDFLSRFELLDYPVQAAQEYARLRIELERAGTPIGGNDLLIAAHALCIPAQLATANVREFKRVPRLRVLEWLK